MTETDHQRVYDLFAASVAQYPSRPMLNVLPATAEIYDIAPGEITYGTAEQAVSIWADRFTLAGYGPGMRVALLLENRPVFFLIWLALNRIGASVVPINPDLRAAELEYLLSHAEPALVITLTGRRAELQLAAEASGLALPVITLTVDLPAPRPGAAVAHCNTSGDGAASQEAAVLYTSGTTGQPKGCVLTNDYFLQVARWYAGLGGIVSLTTTGERMITPLPIFHMNAMAYSFMAMLATGGCLTVLDRFHPRSWWQDVKDSGATCLHYLGVMPSMLMGLEPSAAERSHRVRFGFGAGVDPKLHAAFETRFGFPLMEAWAMTETGAGAVISNHETDRLIGCSALGRVPAGLEVLLQGEDGQPVPTGTPGELLVRRKGADPRAGFFQSYYKNANATDEAWAGGWFHTGDVVRADAAGFLFFVDRKKNVIRRSGENIAAVEVESILMRHPAVKAAAVAPVPDAIRGDEVFACLTLVSEGENSPNAGPELAEEISRWALDQMAYYKVPGHIAFVQKLPLTATQKIQRAALKTLAAELMTDPATVSVAHLKKRQVA